MKNPLTNVSIRSRMLIVLAIFMLPIGMLGYNLNANLQGLIDFSEQESKGAKMGAPLTKMLNLFADYQGSLILKQSGDTTADEDLKATSDDIDKYLGQLTALDAEFGADLDFTPEGLKKHGEPESLTISNLKKKWETAKAASTYSADTYHSLQSDVMAMIKHAGDASGLILDGDLDTYYIVDANFNVFPAVIKELTTLQGEGYSVLHANGNKFDEKSANDLGKIADSLEANYDPHLNDSITTALREDPNFHGVSQSFQDNISKELSTYASVSKEVIAAVRIVEKGGTMKAKDFFETIDKQHNATSQFAQASLAELEKMIEVRVSDLKQDRLKVMGASAAVIVLAFILFFIVSASVSSPIKKMTEVMKQLALRVAIPLSRYLLLKIKTKSAIWPRPCSCLKTT